MTFSWNNYLDIANDIQNLGNTLVSTQRYDEGEAAYRSSISRSYYAAFRISRDYFENSPNISYSPDHSGSDHRKVKKEMKKLNITAYNHLMDLSQWRTICDYDQPIEDPSVIINLNNVKIRLAMAKRVISIVAQLP